MDNDHAATRDKEGLERTMGFKERRVSVSMREGWRAGGREGGQEERKSETERGRREGGRDHSAMACRKEYTGQEANGHELESLDRIELERRREVDTESEKERREARPQEHLAVFFVMFCFVR